MSIDKNKENNEENNKQKKNQESLEGKFIRDFSKDILSGPDKNDFLDKVMKKDKIKSGSFLDKKIKEYQAKNSEFTDLDINNITINKLQNRVSKEYSSLENSRKNYLENTFSSYDLSDKQRVKLESEITRKPVNDLNRLISSDLENKKFLNQVFGENKIDKISNFNFLDNVSESDLKNRLNILSEADKHNVKTSLFNLKNFRGGDIDIKELFSTNFLKENEKKEIISQFIPFITLKKASELGLLDHSEVEQKKKEILKPILEDKGLSGDVLDKALDMASIEDIKIKSSEFFSDGGNLNIIADGVGFRNFEKDIKELRKEINENSISDFEELKTILKGEKYNGVLKKLDNFSEGNFIKIQIKDKDGNSKIKYGKITSISNVDKTIKIKHVGDNSSGKEILNLDSQTYPDSFSFVEFVNLFKSGDKNASFYTETELNQIIDDPKNNIESSDLKQYGPDDLRNNPELVEELQNKYNSQYDSEISILEEEIKNLEEEIKAIKSNINSDNKSDSNEKIKILETKLSKTKLELNSRIKSTNTSISTNDLLQFSNKIELVKKLDELDPDGKDIKSSDGRKGLFAGMFLETKEGIYKVTGVDGKVHLESKGEKGLQPESLTFEEFYQAFKENKAKRLKPLSNLDDFLKENQENSVKKDLWSGFIVKNGELQVKEVADYEKDKSPIVEYLVSENSDNIFKIEDISGDKITFRWGERKDINKLDEKDKKKYKNNIKIGKDGKPETKDGKVQYDGEILSISKNTETLTLTEFNKLINKEKKEFHPDWQTGKNKTVSNPQHSENKFEGSFMTRLFNNLSLGEMYAGAKMMVENIEEYMKKGNDIHAAQVALKFGKMLPKEVQEELLAKVEGSESESMDKEIKSLGDVDSKIATKRIQGWLLNKDTPEFKKEAGMLFMLEKYGSLTVKGPLYPFRGKFLWYEAFGGKIGDELFIQVKEDCKKGGVQFSEEKLMFKLITKQCKEEGGYNGIKRRSRLYKQFEGKAGAGIKEEIEKGEKDGNNQRNFDDRLKEAFGETFSGGDANGLGRYKSAINRGAPLEVMSSYPFAILFSGNGYNMREEVSNEWKNIVGSGFGGLIISRFLSKTDEMDIVNETILKLSYKFKEKDPTNFSSMPKRAQEIFDNQKSTRLSPNEKMEMTMKFWDDYGEALSRTLHYSNDRDDKYIKTDKILILEEDSDPIFKKYNGLVAGITAGDSDFSNKDMMDDQFKNQGISGLSHKVLDGIGSLAQEGNFRNGDAALGIWNELVNEVGKIKDRYKSGIFSKNEAEILLKKELKVIFNFLVERDSQTNVMKAISEGQGFLGVPLAKMGLNKKVLEFGKRNFTSTDILQGNADDFINEISNEYLNSSFSLNTNININNKSFKTDLEPIEETKGKTKDILED